MIEELHARPGSRDRALVRLRERRLLLQLDHQEQVRVCLHAVTIHRETIEDGGWSVLIQNKTCFYMNIVVLDKIFIITIKFKVCEIDLAPYFCVISHKSSDYFIILN